MIELCFSESLAGSLKFASLMRKGETLAGCTAFAALGGTRRERAQARREARKPRVWPGETLDLSPADVRPLTLALDFGPLDDLPERRGALETLFGDFPEACETILRTNAETLRLLPVFPRRLAARVRRQSPGRLAALIAVRLRAHHAPRKIVHAAHGADAPVDEQPQAGLIPPGGIGMPVDLKAAARRLAIADQGVLHFDGLILTHALPSFHIQE